VPFAVQSWIDALNGFPCKSGVAASGRVLALSPAFQQLNFEVLPES
jgi:hypothetical protein